jgi:hypothetical protein
VLLFWSPALKLYLGVCTLLLCCCRQVLTCINIMITSRQQELMEQAAGVSTHTHTRTTSLQHLPLPAAGSLSSALNTTGAALGPDLTISVTAATSLSISGEWDIVRVGSMRKSSGTSYILSSSSLPCVQLHPAGQPSSPVCL